ncbi:hypothetical protein ACIPLC_28620 [Kitasatospora sp. NPDC086801]|uniref:hypothetical protein n=1 Tax=Kitasatospora sp. NPDC086801 TaxID=3364066 RepID=UPI00381C1F27
MPAPASASCWVVTAAPVLTCLIAYKTATHTYSVWPGYLDSFKQIYEAGHDAFHPPLFSLLMALACTIGAQTVLGELTSGLIRTTFIAVPNRSRVLLAKVGIVTAGLTVVGALVAVPSWAATPAWISYGAWAVGSVAVIVTAFRSRDL